jgi:phosphatidylinositol-binding clathrin assembly protein
MHSPTSTYFQQQAAINPFAQMQAGSGQQYTAPQMQQTHPFGTPQFQMQQTSFLAPQQTGFNPFNQQPQMQGLGAGLLPQQTGFLGPQATGANPFRQSNLFPQSTGAASSFGFSQQPSQLAPTPIGISNSFPSMPGPFGQHSQSSSANPFPVPSQSQQAPQQLLGNPFPNFNTANSSSLSNPPPSNSPSNMPAHSNPFPTYFNNAHGGSTPTTTLTQLAPSSTTAAGLPRSASVPPSNNPADPTPLKTHQTGSRNPFGAPVVPAPPVPKVPTLFEIASGRMNASQQPQGNGTASPTALNTNSSGFGAAGAGGGSLIANVASEFTLPSNNNSVQSASGLSGLSFSSSLPRTTSPPAVGSVATPSSLISTLSSQPNSSASASPLQPQMTGFGGLKPFKPSSSFGASLLESLPAIPQSTSTAPSEHPKHTPTGSLGSASLLNTQPTSVTTGSTLGGSAVGIGLRPQATGMAGAANPFRATMFSLSPGPTGTAYGGGLGSDPPGSNFSGPGGGLGSGLGSTPTGQFSFGPSSAFVTGIGTSVSAPTSLNAQQQQNGHASLI